MYDRSATERGATGDRRVRLCHEAARRRASAAATLIAAAAVLASCAAPAAEPGPGARPGAAATPAAVPGQGRTVLDTEFDRGALDRSVWNTCHWWADHGCTIASNDEQEWYLPGQVSTGSEGLELTADRADVTGSDGHEYHYASGMVTTGPPSSGAPAKLAFIYGTVEATFRVPEGQGLWPAVWLLPASGDSKPEIDLMETFGQSPDWMAMRLHFKDRPGQSVGKEMLLPADESLADGWHTVRLDWSPGRLVFFLDGAPVWHVDGDEVPDEPMYLVLNLAVGGHYPGPVDPSTRFPATFAIRHVRIATEDADR